MTAQLTFLDAVHARDRILAAFQAKHSTYVEALRAFAREIALRNEEVTVDDLRTEIERRNFPMPKEIDADERILASVFRCKEFEPIGTRKTSRAAWAVRVGATRSAVTVYRLRKVA